MVKIIFVCLVSNDSMESYSSAYMLAHIAYEECKFALNVFFTRKHVFMIAD